MTLDTTDLLEDLNNPFNSEPEDSWDYYVQEQEHREMIKGQLENIYDEYVINPSDKYKQEWVIMKLYTFMYAKPNMTMHLNRVKGMLEMWLEITKYRALIEAKIISDEDIISNYRKAI